MARFCIFCDRSPTTREHLRPRWSHSLLPRPEGRLLRRIIRCEGSVEGAWYARPYGDVARVVCRACNGGWMSDLEGRAKPVLGRMLQRRDGALSRDNQRTLAAWALKTALVFEHAQGKELRPVLPREEYRHLAKTGEPSGNVLVWLVSYTGPMAAASRLWTGHHAGVPSEGVVYGATITHGRVALQVLVSTVPGWARLLAIDERPGINLIWPVGETLDWSDCVEFDDATLFQFANGPLSVLEGVERRNRDT